MRKHNLLLLLVCLFIISCTQDNDETPVLLNPDGDPPCIADEFGNCLDIIIDPPGGGGGPGSLFKMYMKGLNPGNGLLHQAGSTNGTSWVSQGTPGSTENAPSAVYFNDEILVYRADRNNFLQPHPIPVMRVYVSDDDGANWTLQDLTGTQIDTWAASSAVEFNNEVYMAVTNGETGVNSGVIEVYKSADGLTNWTLHSTPVPGIQNQLNGAPYLTVHNGNLHVFYVSFDNKAYYRRLVGSTWQTDVEVTGHQGGSEIAASGGITAVSFNNQLWAVYKTTSNSMIAVNTAGIGPHTGYNVASRVQTRDLP